MNMFRNKFGKHALLTVAVLMVSVLLMSCFMAIGVLADEGELYTLNIRITTRDDVGEEGGVGVKVALHAGDVIDIDALLKQSPIASSALEGYVYDGMGYEGLPEDGVMPAANLTVRATYVTTPFTVNWIIGDETVIGKAAYGYLPVYPGGTPVKASDVLYTYEFAGWKTPVTEAYADATYEAVFTPVPRFDNGTDATLQDGTLNLNTTSSTVSLKPLLEAYAAGQQYAVNYNSTADGGKLAISLTADDVKAIAAAANGAEDVTLTTSVEGDTIEITVMADGTPVTVNGLGDNRVTVSYKFDTSPDTAAHLYVIENGAPVELEILDLDETAGTLTFKAPHFSTFKIAEEAVLYDVTVTPPVSGGNLTASVTEGAAGSKVILTVTPDAHYVVDKVTYTTADGRTVTVTPVSGEYSFLIPSGGATVTAGFRLETFNVTFVYGDGKTETVAVEYGKGATAPADTGKSPTASTVYTFEKWDKDFSNVTEDLTVNAQYKEETRKYKVTFNYGDGKTSTVEIEYGKGATAPTDTAKATTASTIYTFEKWDKDFSNVTADLTVNAQYKEETRKYKVIFNYGDGKTSTVTVEYGKAAAAPTDTAKASTASTVYTFEKWDKDFSKVTGDMTVSAQYKEETRKYKVTFNYGNGKTSTVQVEYGKGATAPTDTAKASTASTVYTFEKWDKDFSKVTADMTVTAQYKEETRKYKVTFNYGDGKTSTVTVEYGKAATAPTDTAKATTASTIYTFEKWDKDFSKITGDITVTAKYKEETRKYKVTFNYGDGKTETVTVEYGKAATAPADTAKAPTASTSFTFEKWDKDFSKVTADMTVTASYIESVRTFTVTFVYGDGKTDTVTVEYGKNAVSPEQVGKSPDAEFTYTFIGWDKDFTNVTEDITVTARYDAKPVVSDTTPGTESGTSSVTSPETESAPDTDKESTSETEKESDTKPQGGQPSGGCNGSWIWILIVLAVVAVIVVVVIILRRKNGEPHEKTPVAAPKKEKISAPEAEDTVIAPVMEEAPARESADDAAPAAEDAPAAREAPAAPAMPLFIPLGQEPEEEEIPTEIETMDAVAAEDVDKLMSDKVAQNLLESSSESGGSGKMGIINVGLISAAFQAGEVVDLKALQAKGMIDGNVGRLKVLASGVLDKPLTIKASAFSVQAIKMITLTGGHAVRLDGSN